MILRCARCKLYFDARWDGDEIPTICPDCWEAQQSAKILPFRRPA